MYIVIPTIPTGCKIRPFCGHDISQGVGTVHSPRESSGKGSRLFEPLSRAKGSPINVSIRNEAMCPSYLRASATERAMNVGGAGKTPWVEARPDDTGEKPSVEMLGNASGQKKMRKEHVCFARCDIPRIRGTYLRHYPEPSICGIVHNNSNNSHFMEAHT